MRAGRGSSDAYLEDWRREQLRCAGDDLQVLADAKAAELEAQFDSTQLEKLIKAGGVAEK